MTASTKASAKELLRAIEEDQLRLHYQPIVSLQAPDLRICGYEALVRWQHPDRGLLFPASFLPTPTQVNVIDFKWQKPLFDWVFARACKTAATLKGEKYISVNVSPLQFAESGFIQQVKKSIDLLNLERRICLEITEDSISMRELDAIQQALTSLSDSTKIALDDAWTGSSSLWRISELHGLIDLLKIDKIFMPRDSFDRKSIAIYRCFITLADALDLQTVAEGIETQQQVEFCRAIGVTFGQGYYLGKGEESIEGT